MPYNVGGMKRAGFTSTNLSNYIKMENEAHNINNPLHPACFMIACYKHGILMIKRGRRKPLKE